MSEFSGADEQEKPEAPPLPPSPQMQKKMWSREEKSPFQAPQDFMRGNQSETEAYDLLDSTQPQQESGTHAELGESLLGDLQSTPEKVEPETPKGTTIRCNCSKCSKPFEITLPEGLESAYTNCPHCGSEEMVGTV